MKSDVPLITIAVFCAFDKKTLPEAEASLLVAFTRSVRAVYGGGAHIILITDTSLDYGVYVDLVDEVRVHDVQPAQLLLCRARAYFEILRNHNWSSPVAFLDYDILLLRRVDEVFLDPSDVFVTVRSYSKEMPVNGGVLLFNTRHPDRCISFYADVLRRYESLPPSTAIWWGDQISLSAAVFEDCTQVDSACVRTRGGSFVRFIPRNLYNFTPYDVDSGIAIPEMLDSAMLNKLKNNVAIAHFKGPRKHLMLSFFGELQS